MDSMLSQEEINALLNGIDGSDSSSDDKEMLTYAEKDAIGEVSNISMGSAATTLASLVSNRVTITTPVVNYAKWDDIIKAYEKPCVMVHISYKEGLNGKNVLLLEEDDVKIIADLMMGGDGTNIEGEVTELHLSAISEAMNQMMGTSATSLSSLIDRKVDISPPNARLIDINLDMESLELEDFLKEMFIMVSFKLEIGELIDSKLMQLYPISFAKEIYEKFAKEIASEEPEKKPESETVSQPKKSENKENTPPIMPEHVNTKQIMTEGMVTPNVNVQPVQFASFAGNVNPTFQHENIDLIMDVPLEVTVELGRTNRSIKEILDFKPGTIIELDKVAGEPIDILVNGKYIARGEVVVIDECFGIRVTDIIK